MRILNKHNGTRRRSSGVTRLAAGAKTKNESDFEAANQDEDEDDELPRLAISHSSTVISCSALL